MGVLLDVHGLAVLPDGDLVVAGLGLWRVHDGILHKIPMVVPSTPVAPGQLPPLSSIDIDDLAVDSAGRIVFSGNGLIRRIEANGTLTTLGGDGIIGAVDVTKPATKTHVNARAIAAAPNGSIYAVATNPLVLGADAGVYRIDPDGSIHLAVVQAYGPRATKTGCSDVAPVDSSTTALAVDRHNRLYVNGGKVRLDGTLQTTALRDDDPPTVTGVPAGVAALAADASDRMVLADTGNNRVRRIDPIADTPSTACLLLPFSNADALVQQQLRDFQQPQPSIAQLKDWAARLRSGDLTSAHLVDVLAHRTSWSEPLGSVVRLYAAFLGTLPASQYVPLRMLAQPIDVARALAASPTFVAKYGKLSNSAFVDAAYRNVLGRAATATERASWVHQLASHSRAWVMLQLAQSTAYRQKTATSVDSVLTYFGLLGRVPTATENKTWVARSATGTARLTLVAGVFALPAYRDRVAPAPW